MDPIDSSTWTGRGPKWEGRALFDSDVMRACQTLAWMENCRVIENGGYGFWHWNPDPPADWVPEGYVQVKDGGVAG